MKKVYSDPESRRKWIDYILVMYYSKYIVRMIDSTKSTLKIRQGITQTNLWKHFNLYPSANLFSRTNSSSLWWNFLLMRLGRSKVVLLMLINSKNGLQNKDFNLSNWSRKFWGTSSFSEYLHSHKWSRYVYLTYF